MQAKELSIYRKGLIPMLIAIQAIVLFPLWFELPAWISAVTITLMVIKFLMYRYDFKLPSWLVLMFVFGSLAGVFIYFRTISGRDAGVSLICLMYGFKLLESKTYRDAALTLFISFFIMVMAFLFNQSIEMGLYLLVAMVVILSGTVALNSIEGIKGIKYLSKISGVALLQATPIMLVLFFLFPRLPGPLWGVHDANQGGTGISDSMTPGDIGILALFDDPAFRVKFDGDIPSSNDMYWRGMVFTEYDGVTWREGKRSRLRKSNTPSFTVKYKYRVQMEPNKSRWIFGLEHLATPPKSSSLFSDFTWRYSQKIYSQLTYQAQSVVYDYQGVILSDSHRSINLQLPRSGNLKTRKWAQDLFSQSNSTQDFIQRVLSVINEQEYYYTLTPKILDEEMVDSFWLGSREGFCEHYAGAFVFIMRAAGIPARVVTGYQGGEYNPYGDFYLIKQSDAHAWTEVWIDDQGWVRIDPTAAIHPNRIEEDLRARTTRRDSWFSDKDFGFDLPESFWEKAAMRWDAIKSFWDDSLMGYGQDQQNDWLSKLGIKSNQWRYLGYGLATTLILSGLIFGLWLLRKSANRDPVEKYYELLKSKLVKEGVEIPHHYGPKSILELLQKEYPNLAKKFSTPLQFYIAIRYKDSADEESWLKRFKAQVKAL